MRVKICGITNLNDALECCRLGADAIGFVFFKKSSRFITVEKARDILSEIPPFISTVGVFVDETADRVNHISGLLNLDYVQLHGSESPEYVSSINSKTIKAFRISKEFDFSILNKYNSSYILLDSFDEIEAGGTGKSFDWNMIPDKLRNRIILSGGISGRNITEIIEKISPRGVDLSSSVEKAPGIKDKIKLKMFFKKIEEAG